MDDEYEKNFWHVSERFGNSLPCHQEPYSGSNCICRDAYQRRELFREDKKLIVNSTAIKRQRQNDMRGEIDRKGNTEKNKQKNTEISDWQESYDQQYEMPM